MLYSVMAMFRPGAEAGRQAAHAAYSFHVSQRHPRVRLGGPLLNDEGARVGVLLLVDADSRAEVDSFVARSPYTQAGLYERVEVHVLDVEVGGLT